MCVSHSAGQYQVLCSEDWARNPRLRTRPSPGLLSDLETFTQPLGASDLPVTTRTLVSDLSKLTFCPLLRASGNPVAESTSFSLCSPSSHLPLATSIELDTPWVLDTAHPCLSDTPAVPSPRGRRPLPPRRLLGQNASGSSIFIRKLTVLSYWATGPSAPLILLTFS